MDRPLVRQLGIPQAQERIIYHQSLSTKTDGSVNVQLAGTSESGTALISHHVYENNSVLTAGTMTLTVASLPIVFILPHPSFSHMTIAYASKKYTTPVPRVIMKT